jgi:hypothetical protein
VSGLRSRVDRTIEVWRGREITSGRMLVTGVGFLGLLLPVALFYLVIGPTAGDRLVALGLAVAAITFGLYSLWEAKAPGPPEGRPKRHIEDP